MQDPTQKKCIANILNDAWDMSVIQKNSKSWHYFHQTTSLSYLIYLEQNTVCLIHKPDNVQYKFDLPGLDIQR